MLGNKLQAQQNVKALVMTEVLFALEKLVKTTRLLTLVSKCHHHYFFTRALVRRKVEEAN